MTCRLLQATETCTAFGPLFYLNPCTTFSFDFGFSESINKHHSEAMDRCITNLGPFAVMRHLDTFQSGQQGTTYSVTGLLRFISLRNLRASRTTLLCSCVSVLSCCSHIENGNDREIFPRTWKHQIPKLFQMLATGWDLSIRCSPPVLSHKNS